MKNIRIIGDSQTMEFPNIVPDYFIKKNPDHKFIDSHNKNLYSYSDNQYNLSFSYNPGASAYNFEYNKEYMKNWNTKKENIIPFLGYVDIRIYLAKYKNTDDVVKIYIEKTLKKFNKSNVVFMEPIPQFISYVGYGLNSTQENPDPDVDFETRYDYHYEFIQSLKNS